MPDPTGIARRLYSGFFERGIRYFFPEANFESLQNADPAHPSLTIHSLPDGKVEMEWMDLRYRLSLPARAFTEHQVRLLGAVGGVLSARYRGVFFGVSAAATSHLFEGIVEDRYVSAFLDRTPYADDGPLSETRDIVADALGVLRECSLITYENRRISTGVLLVGDGRAAPPPPDGALAYTDELIAIKSFQRLCDGRKTVFLVDRNGLLIDLVDLREWSEAHDCSSLPAPTAARYRSHSAATLQGGHFCLVLTANGEIKVFAEGAQVFSFLEGRWRLTDAAEKYHQWCSAIGHAALAERLLTASLNLAEHRRGSLFLVIDDPSRTGDLVAPGDLLSNGGRAGKAQVHYLLRGKCLLDLEPSVLESIARMDGAILLDRSGNLLAFGAILRPGHSALDGRVSEGGRTTAAIQASHYGSVLKISEDGVLSHYREGALVWDI